MRTGFFERDEFEAVRAALPEPLRGVVTFAYLTGWRIRSEVLPLHWSQIDRFRKTIRLEPGTTKNSDGRTLPYDLLPDLVDVIDDQWKAHEQLKKTETIAPTCFTGRGRQSKPLRSRGPSPARPLVIRARSRTTSGGPLSGTWCVRACPRRPP